MAKRRHVVSGTPGHFFHGYTRSSYPSVVDRVQSTHNASHQGRYSRNRISERLYGKPFDDVSIHQAQAVNSYYFAGRLPKK